jgi:hypothetical protein
MKQKFLLFTITAGAIVAPAFAQHQHANPPAIIKRIGEPKLATRLDSTGVNPIAVLSPHSPLSRYQRFNLDEPLTDWIVANNTVRDIGGWREYAKESARANANVNAKPGVHGQHNAATPNPGVKP